MKHFPTQTLGGNWQVRPQPDAAARLRDLLGLSMTNYAFDAALLPKEADSLPGSGGVFLHREGRDFVGGVDGQGRRQMFELAGEILMDKKQAQGSLYNEVSRDFAYITARYF